MKSEPHVYSYDDLVSDGSTHWDGVRNYQARNFMRDDMKLGDLILYYHSNTKPPHIAGIAKICKEGYPDFTSFDSDSKYFDEKSSPENPRWIMVDIEPVIKLEDIISLLQTLFFSPISFSSSYSMSLTISTPSCVATDIGYNALKFA